MCFAWKDEHMETFLEMFTCSCVDAPNCSRRPIQGFTHLRWGRRFFLISNIFRHSSARAKLINSIQTLTIPVADILRTGETNWTIERYRYSSFHRSHSLRMNHLRCTSKVQKCKLALGQTARCPRYCSFSEVQLHLSLSTVWNALRFSVGRGSSVIITTRYCIYVQ
jgi:hypothetical protein